MDLLEEFLDAFRDFHFDYDLWITTDVEEKKQAIEQILSNRATRCDGCGDWKYWTRCVTNAAL